MIKRVIIITDPLDRESALTFAQKFKDRFDGLFVQSRKPSYNRTNRKKRWYVVRLPFEGEILDVMDVEEEKILSEL